MTGFLGGAYLWVKAAHLIFVIFWMAGLFLYPRYLVHHQDALGTPEAEKWKEREIKLGRMILAPSFGLTFLLGFSLAVNAGLLDGGAGLGWLRAKLLLVFGLFSYQWWMRGYAWALWRGEARLPTRTLRMLNEVPALAVILIVILAVVKPF